MGIKMKVKVKERKRKRESMMERKNKSYWKFTPNPLMTPRFPPISLIHDKIMVMACRAYILAYRSTQTHRHTYLSIYI